MKAKSLLFLRISLGWLLVIWGLDKVVNVEHSIAVADRFYLGIGSQATFLAVFGVLEIALGLLVVLGLWRRFAYPAMLVIALVSGLSVWKSILDPWGWALEGTNALFYPSLIIMAGAIVMWAFRDQDTLSLDARRV